MHIEFDMTRSELIHWVNAPEQKENVVAEAVRKALDHDNESTRKLSVVYADLAIAQAAIRNYEAECARLRKAALPQAPWESEEEVPM